MFAEMDLKALQSYQILIKEIGLRHCVDPALIAAIISRESHGGTILLDGWDHTGLKFGLMQVLNQTLFISPTPSFLIDYLQLFAFILGFKILVFAWLLLVIL